MDTRPQRVLGFDFGLKRIGVASGQMITQTATPVGILQAHHGTLTSRQIHTLVQTWHPQALIVGIPLNMDGSPSPIALPAETFACFLETATDLPVYRADERLTTKIARSLWNELSDMSDKKRHCKRVDALSAVLILEEWLRAQNIK